MMSLRVLPAFFTCYKHKYITSGSSNRCFCGLYFNMTNFLSLLDFSSTSQMSYLFSKKKNKYAKAQRCRFSQDLYYCVIFDFGQILKAICVGIFSSQIAAMAETHRIKIM